MKKPNIPASSPDKNKPITSKATSDDKEENKDDAKTSVKDDSETAIKADDTKAEDNVKTDKAKTDTPKEDKPKTDTPIKQTSSSPKSSHAVSLIASFIVMFGMIITQGLWLPPIHNILTNQLSLPLPPIDGAENELENIHQTHQDNLAELAQTLKSLQAQYQDLISENNNLQSEINNLKLEMTTLIEEQIKTLSLPMAETDTSGIASELKNKISLLEEIVSNLHENISTSNQEQITALRDEFQNQLNGLNEKLASTLNEGGFNQSQLSLFAVRFSLLEGAIGNGKDFQKPLQDLLSQDELLNKNPAMYDLLSSLIPYQSGVMRRDALTIAFQAHASDIHNDITVPQDGNWWHKGLYNLSQTISIRKTEGDGGLPPVTIALNLLDQGVLDEAIDMLSPYQDQSPALKDWLKSATARSAVDKALDSMRIEMASGFES